MPLCPHFLEKTESINKKILDYYSSNNYKKILKIYNKNLHYKTNIEAHPKIDIYVNFAKINNESSFTNKLNIDKLFNKEEKQLILLEPDYYFKNTYKDCFENINIIKSNKLVEKMNKEDMMKEQLDKKEKRKNRTPNNCIINKINNNNNKALNKTEIKKTNYEDDYICEYNKNKKLVENLIAKENKIKQGQKLFNIEEAFEKEIKNGYYKYLHFINENRKVKRNPLNIKKISNLLMRKNLISNNYRHIIKFEEKFKNNNAGNDRRINNISLNSKSMSKDNFKNLSKIKQIEYIKNLVNQIKNIYNK